MQQWVAVCGLRIQTSWAAPRSRPRTEPTGAAAARGATTDGDFRQALLRGNCRPMFHRWRRRSSQALVREPEMFHDWRRLLPGAASGNRQRFTVLATSSCHVLPRRRRWIR